MCVGNELSIPSRWSCGLRSSSCCRIAMGVYKSQPRLMNAPSPDVGVEDASSHRLTSGSPRRWNGYAAKRGKTPRKSAWPMTGRRSGSGERLENCTASCSESVVTPSLALPSSWPLGTGSWGRESGSSPPPDARILGVASHTARAASSSRSLLLLLVARPRAIPSSANNN